METMHNYELIQSDLDNNTDEEVRKKYEISKTEWKRLVKEGIVIPKYARRTPLTNGLIPIEDPLFKLSGKKRDKYNSLDKGNMIQREIETRKKCVEQNSLYIGGICARLMQDKTNLLKLAKDNQKQKHLINALEQLKDDYVGFLEEERYGIIEEPTDMFNEILDDNGVVALIYERYGMSAGMMMNKIINRKE